MIQIHKTIHTITLICTLLFSYASNAADITYYRGSDEYKNLKYIKINGKIERGDFEKYIKIIKEIGYIPAALGIKSSGGDVTEAMKFGRFARKAMLYISADEECASSCFLIVAGGISRASLSPIGLHRPVYDKSYFSGLTYQEAQDKYDQLDSLVRKYMIEMDIPMDIIDKMMSTPNEDIFMWDEWVASSYGVGHEPPAYHEWVSAKCGSLSKEEKEDAIILMFADTIRKQKTEQMNENNKRIMQKADALSKGYAKYLSNKYSEIKLCAYKATLAERQQIFNRLMQKGVEGI